MVRFVLRRLGQSALTVFGVMVLTFVLFRVMAGDIAAGFSGPKATEAQKADWRHLEGYDRPLLLNVHRQLLIEDHTEGESFLRVESGEGLWASDLADKLSMIPSDETLSVSMGRYVFGLDRDTPVAKMVPKPPDLPKGAPKPLPPKKTARWPVPGTDALAAWVNAGSAAVPAPTGAVTRAAPAGFLALRTVPLMVLKLSDGAKIHVNLAGAKTCGDILDRINDHPDNVTDDGGKRVTAGISDLKWSGLFDSQFADHLRKSVTFQSYSLVHKERLTDIIIRRAPKSLALTVPALALTWVLGMIISCLVAYYRGRMIDHVGVFLSVLGMCVPFLAFMIYGQWLMFEIAPKHAFGIENRANIYVPIAVMVIAGLGGTVRFYRTVILDEVNRDYVRTARAKGLPLTGVLFKHVLRNCMLPILTNLIMAIPFLIMGSLVVEQYFGIPGLGDLMLSSINNRDEPVISGMVFLTSVIYTLAVLVTDLSYSLFDPRVRLR